MKKTINKKFIAMFLALLMILSLIPATVFAATVNETYSDVVEYQDGTPAEGVAVKLVNYDDPSVIIDTDTTKADGSFSFDISFDDEDGFDGLIQIDTQAFIPASNTVYNGNGNLPSGSPRLGYPVTYYPGGLLSGKQEIDVIKVTGSVTLTKTDRDTGNAIANAKYRLVKGDEPVANYIAEYTTDSLGQITINNLPYGNYRFVEISAPSNYFVNNADVPFSITANGQILTLSHKDVAKCSVTLTKTDKDSDAKLSGIKYNLYIVGTPDTLIGNFETNAEGTITLNNLVPGNYYFVETETKENYILDDTKINFAVSSTLPNAILNPTNTHYPEVTINKYITGTSTFLANADLVILKNGTPVKSIKTNGGAWKVFLEPGDYVLRETNAPAGYLESVDKPFTVTLDGGNIVNMYDIPITLRVEKYCEQDDGSYVLTPGASFRLTNLNDTSIVYTWTNLVGQDAKHTITGIPAGDYRLEEINAQQGYNAIANKTITVEETAKVQVEEVRNTLKTYDVNIEKVNNKNELLDGCDFTITGTHNTDIDFNGSQKTLSLKRGTYTITETSAKAGYIESDPIVFTINNNGIISNESGTPIDKISIVNQPIQISIAKYEINTNNLLAGAVLELYNSSNVRVHRWTSSSTKAEVIDAIPSGTYRIHEVTAPNGYELADDVNITVRKQKELQSFSIDDELIKSTITFIKVNGDTNEYLSGVEFTLYDSNDVIVKKWTTNEDGPYEVSGLIRGDYKLVETKTPTGYLTIPNILIHIPDDASTIMYNVNSSDAVISDDNTTLTIKNYPTKVSLYKCDIETESTIKDAALRLQNEAGTYTYDFVSTESATELKALEPGIYYITEIEAPEGYVRLKKPVKITVKAIKDVQEFNIYNDFTKVEITKYINGTKKTLAGAVYELRNANGDLVDKWTTTDKAHQIAKLPVGTYTLIEISAPKGYKLSKNMTFKVEETDEIQTVSVYDDKITVSIPKTGDDMMNNYNIYVSLSMLSLGVAMLIVKKRKTFKK